MFNNIAALDIGSSSVKLVLAKTTIRNFKIEYMICQNLNLDIPYEEALSAALKSIIQKHDLSKYQIITNCPVEKSIIRDFQFPFNDEDKISDALPFMIQENTPFKIEDLKFDFQYIDKGNGKIIVEATHSDFIDFYSELFKDNNLIISHMGFESNSICECYTYFNDIENENVLLVDIGYSKTIINLINNNNLIFTRCITIGTNNIIKTIAKQLKITNNEANEYFNKLNIDLTSLDNNYKRQLYKSYKISKQKFRNIFNTTIETYSAIREQILLSLKSFEIKNPSITFERVLLSGGGSNIIGLGNHFSEEINLPFNLLPFSEEYTDSKIKSQFPMVFGILLSYLNNKKRKINLILTKNKHSFSFQYLKKFRLAIFFTIIAFIILFINIIISSIIKNNINSNIEKQLIKQFKQYFRNIKIKDNVISTANEILSKEKKELRTYLTVIPDDKSAYILLNDIVRYFPNDTTFNLRNIVINKKAVKISGETESINSIESFKQKLTDSKKFDSVRLNTRTSSQSIVRFTLNIKLKIIK